MQTGNEEKDHWKCYNTECYARVLLESEYI